MKNKNWIFIIGLVSFILNAILLFFHVKSSWCDDVAYVDLARQIGLYGSFYSNDWGYVDTCCPLYVLILAPIIKLFGMNYFMIHLPALLISLISYYLLAFYFDKKELIKDKSVHLFFGVALWWLPQLFWINNCGRIENLCLLSAIGTILLFEKYVNTPNVKYALYLFLMAIVMFWSGVQGTIFATLVLLVYSLCCWKKVFGQWKSWLLLMLGYVTGFFANCVLAYSQGGLSCLFSRMFGFSNTIKGVYEPVLQFLKTLKNGTVVDSKISTDVIEASVKTSATNVSLIDNLISAYTFIADYWILILLIITFAVYFLSTKKKFAKESLILIIVTLICPTIFVLAGRYTGYYTWTSIVSGVCTLSLLLQQSFIENCIYRHLLTYLLCVIVVIAFCISPSIDRKWDWNGDIDKRNEELVNQAEKYLNKDWGTYIPHKWYYYVIEKDENVWYMSTPGVQDNVRYVIYDPYDYDEMERLHSLYNLHEVDRIEDKIVYEVVE